jgi:chloramphenicol 3-O phosphotransferase
MLVMAESAAPGQVVLLNGVSGSGKSTIARQLLADFHTPWFHMGVDMFGAMRAEVQTHELDADALLALGFTAPLREWRWRVMT